VLLAARLVVQADDALGHNSSHLSRVFGSRQAEIANIYSLKMAQKFFYMQGQVMWWIHLKRPHPSPPFAGHPKCFATQGVKRPYPAPSVTTD